MSTELIVASDSHGRGDLLKKLEQAYPKADLFLHCGDVEEETTLYPRWVFVRGNNDWYFDVPEIRILKLDGHKIMMTHSHLFGYRNRKEAMALKAKENGCDLVLFGHSHHSEIDIIHGVVLVNPGSIAYPRDGNPPSYAIVELEKDEIPKARIVFEDEWPFGFKREGKPKRRFFF